MTIDLFSNEFESGCARRQRRWPKRRLTIAWAAADNLRIEIRQREDELQRLKGQLLAATTTIQQLETQEHAR